MNKHLLGGFIAGVLSSSVVYATDEENKIIEITCDDIKIEASGSDIERGKEGEVVTGQIKVRIGGKWYPFKNRVYLESESGPDPMRVWEVK